MKLYVIKKRNEKFVLEDNLDNVYSEKGDAEGHLAGGYIVEELNCPFVHGEDAGSGSPDCSVRWGDAKYELGSDGDSVFVTNHGKRVLEVTRSR